MTSSFSDKGRAAILDRSAEILRSEIQIYIITCHSSNKLFMMFDKFSFILIFIHFEEATGKSSTK